MSNISVENPTRPAVAGSIERELPEMVSIRPGRFQMGADEADDKFVSVLEIPRHEVRITKSFSVSRTPITFSQWDHYCESDPALHRPDDYGWGRGALPVFNVSFLDALGFCEWLTRQTGRRYRLPSEAEWEYSCRAGTDSVFHTGSRLNVSQANYLYTDFRERPGLARPVPVGSYPPNAFGLHDMIGNVCELVADPWHDSYVGAPVDGSVWEAPGNSRWRVVRNGGWDAMPRILRSAFRDWVRDDQRLDNMGFRVACDNL